MTYNSYDPDRETIAVRLYLDESDDGQRAVLGGMLINRSYYPHFEEAWDELLDDFKMPPPLHMNEFGRPHGRFAQMDDCCRRELFERVAELVNFHKLWSLDAQIGTAHYNRHISETVQKKFSLYGLCFLMTAAMNRRFAEFNKYKKEIAFVLDSGNSKAGHVLEAHGQMIKMQRAGEFANVGPLAFVDDTNLGCLQAADVIAWGARRKSSGKPLGSGFEPINKILEEKSPHFNWQPSWLEELSHRLEARIKLMEQEQAPPLP